MKIVLRILGIILIVLGLLFLVVIPPFGVVCIGIGILCIVKSGKAKSRQLSKSPEESGGRTPPAEMKIAGAGENQSYQIDVFHSSRSIIHEDIKDLLWIADGKYKNFTEDMNDDETEHIFIDELHFIIRYNNAGEPSLIYTALPISKPDDEAAITRPPYFPTYSGLSPEQRWIYLKLLANPYNPEIDVGYVFILYYGLERHLLQGNFEDAFRVILKLRDVYGNKSFQSYSAKALILSSMLHKKGEFALEFINSLDKEYEFDFSNNLFLILYYSFDIPLQPKDIMRMAKTFEFTNTNYIKKNPDIFVDCLAEVIEAETGGKAVDIKKYITKTELRKIRNEEARIFANSSIKTTDIPVPMLAENFKLKKAVNACLETAHERTKAKVAELRKSGALPKPEPVPIATEQPKNRPPSPPIDPEYLNGPSEDLNTAERHYFYKHKINAFYIRRDEKPEYLELAIKACEDQIAMSKKVAEEFLEEKRFILKSEDEVMDDYKKLLRGIDVYAKYDGMELPEGFDPHIHKGPEFIKIIKHDTLPEHYGFKQLCIIRETQGNYEEVIRLATRAKEEGWTGNWDRLIAKAQKKLGQGK
jgi:hypothetical protein